MKKTIITLIALSAMLAGTHTSQGQRNEDRRLYGEIQLLLGGSLGDYGKYTSIEKSALYFDETNKATGNKEAGAGFTGGIGGRLGLNLLEEDNTLSAFLSLDVMASRLNTTLRKEFGVLGAPEHLNKQWQCPTYINVPIMLGVHYDLDFTQNIGIFGEAGLGLSFNTITPLKETYSYIEKDGRTGETSLTMQPKVNTAFAFQVGVGFNLGQRIRLGVHYYNLAALGTTDVKYTISGTLYTTAGITKEDLGTINAGKIHPHLLMGALSFIL